METNFLLRLIIFISSHLPVFPVSAGGLADGVVEWAKDNLTESLGGLLDTGEAMCSLFTGSDAYGIGTAVSGLEDTVIAPIMTSSASIGLVICFACWVFAVVELTIQDRLTPETFVKSMARLGLGVALCSNVTTIATGIKDFGKAFAEMVGDGAASSGASTLELVFDGLEENKNNWMMIALNTILINTVCILETAVITIASYIVQVSLVIERGIRGAFLGIAMGMLADDGWKGPGARYIKKYIAICCQGAVLVLIGTITSNLMGHVAASGVFDSAFDGSGTGMLTGLFVMGGVGFAGVSLMFKSLGFINDVFGA